MIMQAKVEIKYKDGSVETNKYASQQKYDKANTVKNYYEFRPMLQV